MTSGEGNPWGPLVSAGNQYPEARAFTRQYGGNPYAQSRLLEALVGLHRIPAEGWANIDMSEIEKQAATINIAQTIKYVAEQFPEWRKEDFTLESDFGMPPYHAEPRLVHLVDRVIESLEQPE